MIYLISQITFLFLTEIYYNMNFVTSSSILPQDFPGTLRLIFADCFWRTFFCGTQKMHICEYICKTCLKELGILLKCRLIFEKFIAAYYLLQLLQLQFIATILKILVFHNFFSKIFGKCI